MPKDISQLVIDTYSNQIGVFHTCIPLSVRAAEISAEGSSIYQYDPKGKAESNRFQQLTITKKKLQEYFPTFYTKSQMEKVLFDLLADWKKKQDEEG